MRTIALLLLLLLTACGGSNPQPADADTPAKSAAVEPDRLRIGMRSPPDSFNPYLSVSIYGEIIAKRLYSQLYREEPRMENGFPLLTPVLVDSADWNQERTAVTLKLKPGLTWSDGEPLTSADVAYSLDIRRDENVAWLASDSNALLKGYQVLSPQEITVEFTRASPFNLLNLNEGFIIPRHHFNKVSPPQWREHDWSKDLVVFGPYRISTWAPGEKLVLAPVKEGDAPTLGFAFIRERESLFKRVRDNELDFAWSMPTTRIKDLAAPMQPHIYSNLRFAFIAWNPMDRKAGAGLENRADLDRALLEQPHPIFADKRVRQAMTYAMQRKRYLNDVWAGHGFVPVSPWSAGPAYHQSALETRTHDAAKAAALLDEAGWTLVDGVRQKDGVPLRFKVASPSGNAVREAYLLAIQADLKALGVTMEIDMMEAGRWTNAAVTHDFDGLLGIFRAGTRPDLSSLFHGDAAVGGYNFAAWTGADADQERLRDTADLTEVAAALGAVEARFYDDQPITMLYGGSEVSAASAATEGIHANYLDPLAGVEDWRR